jgi:hypothetical protein
VDIVEDVVEFFCIGVGGFWWGTIVESGRHDGLSSKERVLILLD